MTSKPIKTYYLKPAELVLLHSAEAREITTVLGSCVSVCFYDAYNGNAAMCHFMLPLWNGQGLASPRYGNIALDKCIKHMLRHGSKKSNIIAKVFGGARILHGEKDVFNIGERNVEIAYDYLKQEKIEIFAASTGGMSGRKIIFNSQSGLIRMKYIKKKPIN